MSISDPDHEWATEVGRGLLAFGSIEWTVLRCFTGISPEPLSKTKLKAGLSDQMAGVAKHMAAKPTSASTDLLLQFEQVRELLPIRNLVAHSPLSLDIYTDESKDEFVVLHTISSHKTTASVSFQELSAWREAAEKLSHRLFELVESHLAKIKPTKFAFMPHSNFTI